MVAPSGARRAPRRRDEAAPPTGGGTWPRCRPEADDVIADTFVCVEGFRDADAGASHVGTQAFKDFVERAPDLVARQPEIIYVDAPDVSGWGPMGEIQPR